MTALAIPPVDYTGSARRHFTDAETLLTSGRTANAGQLFGLVAECGLKAMLVACKVQTDADGSIPKCHALRQHVPNLVCRVVSQGHLIPDGRLATAYMATMPSLNMFGDWMIDHRYWRDPALPLKSVAGWRIAAKEVLAMLDQATEDGVL